MGAKLMDRPKFKKSEQVIAAGVLGEVVDPDAGTAGGDRVYGQAERLVAVRWQGETGTVDVRESLLTKRGPKR